MTCLIQWKKSRELGARYCPFQQIKIPSDIQEDEQMSNTGHLYEVFTFQYQPIFTDANDEYTMFAALTEVKRLPHISLSCLISIKYSVDNMITDFFKSLKWGEVARANAGHGY